ncbi:MAG: SpoIIE family protein phosphatase [Blastocatellia bacterium]|nr:SpoIIE family protein phosphatase [Blastocatellia bacterium]
MKTSVRVGLCLAFLSLMTATFAVVNYARFQRLRASYDGWGAGGRAGQAILIRTVDATGPAAALRPGDEVVSVDGITPQQDREILNHNLRRRPGEAYRMVVRRDGRELEFNFRLVAFPARNWIPEIVQALLVALFLGTGLLVFALKPKDKQAALLALMLSSFASLIGVATAGLPRVLLVGLLGTARVGGMFVLPFILHFFLVFPDRSPWLRRYPWLERMLYAPFLLFLYPAGGARIYGDYGVSLPGAVWIREQSWLNALTVAMVLGYMLAGLVALVVNYRAAEPAARRRARVAVVGAGAGLFTLFALITGDLLQIYRGRPGLYATLDFLQFFTLPLIPISFAYAIIRHKVIPVSLILRRGVRYLLVSRGSVLLELIAVFVVVTIVLNEIFKRTRPSGIVVGVVSAAVGIATWKLTSRLHDVYLAPVIDRMFFRQSYDAHQILAVLADSLRTTTSLPQLLEQVATKIQSALQTESVTVLLREDATGDYVSGYACRYEVGGGKAVSCEMTFRLSRYAESLSQLAQAGQPLEIDLEETGMPGASERELAELRRMRAAMLLPLLAKEGMPAILALGPRLGDLPYSGEDRRLLMSVAGPTTFAIENARLVERMIEEARRREEVEAENEARAKELEEARQLQISMLPRVVPQLPHVQVAAYMKTATEVGGDYYDFHVADDGTLTVVVGDATGHGLKAGTVVTATKSLFNHLAPSSDIPGIFQSSSRALKQMNLRSLFMAMMMVKLQGGRLTLSSAGMPPLLIYRARERRVEEVLIKALPLGSLTSYQYHEHRFQLEIGDVLLLMSDGFPERFNSLGEMMESEVAADVLRAHASSSPQRIIEELIRTGDAWAAGAPQNDDVTFVVLKIISAQDAG